jgi:hypothetical protein
VDALAPALLLTITFTLAEQSSGSPTYVAALLIGCVIALAAGTMLAFFRDISEAHITWPLAFGLVSVVVPLLALHMQLEWSAINAPVPVHLLALAFTWTALLVAACTIIGIVLTSAATMPRWAGVAVMPVPLLLGWAPVLAFHSATGMLFSAAIFVAVLTGIAAGVAWLLPEQWRWFVIPVTLVVGGGVIWQRFTAMPHHLPGRWLLLIDVGMALATGAMALAAPPLCRWLQRHSAARVIMQRSRE